MFFNDTSTNCNHKDIFKNGHYHIAFNIILWYVDTLVFIKYVLFKTYTKTGRPYTIVVPIFNFSKFHTKNFCLPTRKPSTMVYGHPLLSSKSSMFFEVGGFHILLLFSILIICLIMEGLGSKSSIVYMGGEVALILFRVIYRHHIA